MRALTHGVSVGGVNPRKSGGENACLHGSKRENAALIEDQWPGRVKVVTLRMVPDRITAEWLGS
jgi:hypothetical protein